MQSVAEMLYEFVVDMVDTNAGHGARTYFPFVFTLFMFILFANLLGLMPWSFTVTSHIIVTFALALVVFIGVTIIGIARHGAHFLRLFVPEGVPLGAARPAGADRDPVLFHPPVHAVDPAVRQHAGRAHDAGDLRRLRGGGRLVRDLLRSAINIALFGLEILVAVLQAYVFAILTCLYLRDALHLH